MSLSPSFFSVAAPSLGQSASPPGLKQNPLPPPNPPPPFFLPMASRPRLFFAHCALRCLIPDEAAALSATALALAAAFCACCWICFFCPALGVAPAGETLRAGDEGPNRVGMTIRDMNSINASRSEQNLFPSDVHGRGVRR